MGDQILEIIKKLGIFIIISQTIVHFCPNNSYERYIRMLVGIMIISLMVIPVAGIFFSQVEFDYASRLSQFEKDFYEAVESVEFQEELDSGIAEEEVIEETEEKIKTRLNNAIQGIEINGEKSAEGENSEILNRYKVTQVSIRMVEQETYLLIIIDEMDGSSDINVEKVQVGESDNKNTGDINNGEVVEKLREFFAEQLGIQKENLEVNWGE